MWAIATGASVLFLVGIPEGVPMSDLVILIPVMLWGLK